MAASPERSGSEIVEINLVQVARFFYSNRFILIGLTLLFPLLVGFWKTVVVRPIYRAEIHLLLDLEGEDQQLKGPQSLFFNQEAMVSQKLELIEKYFESREFAKMVDGVLSGTDPLPEVSKQDLDLVLPLTQTVEPGESKADAVLGLIEFRSNIEKFRIELAARNRNAEVTAAAANIVGLSLVEFNRRIHLRRVHSVKNFLLDQTEKTRGELTEQERGLVQLQVKLKMVSPDEMRSRVNFLQLEQYSKYVELAREENSLNSLIEGTKKQIRIYQAMSKNSETVSASFVDQLQKRLEILRYQRSQLELSEDSRGLRGQIEKEIGKVQKQLEVAFKSEAAFANNPWALVKKLEAELFDLTQKQIRVKSELAASEKAVGLWKSGFVDLPENLRLLNELRRKIELSTALYTSLKSKLQETEIREAAQINDLLVISKAEVPTITYGMGLTKSVLLGFGVGLFFSCIVLGLKFALVPTIRDSTDLERFQISLLGEIPLVRKVGKGFLQFANVFPLVTRENPMGDESSAIRLIRFKLERLLSLADRRSLGEGKVISVLSPNQGEGKTFFVSNLADLVSMASYKTLILSFDFRKRGLKDVFNKQMKNPTRVDLAKFNFYKYDINENLTIIESDPVLRNWSDELESSVFRETFANWKKEYDLIIIDTPPMKGSIEPLISAQYADAVILVINQRTTLREDLDQQLKHLRDSLHVSIFGVVNAIYDEFSWSSKKVQAQTNRNNEDAA